MTNSPKLLSEVQTNEERNRENLRAQYKNQVQTENQKEAFRDIMRRENSL